MAETASGRVSPKSSLRRVATSESTAAAEEPKSYAAEDETLWENVAVRRPSKRPSVVSSIAPEVEEEKKQSFVKSAWNMVRPGWLMDHLDYAGFKSILRTWAVAWVGFVLADIPGSSDWFGMAAYLTSIVGFALAPGGQPYIITAMICMACLIFVLVGWIYAIVASAITTSIRGNPTAASTAQQLVAAGICQDNADLPNCVKLQIFSGYFLEFRCSVIFILALLMGVTMFSMCRRLSPMLTIAHIAGCIGIVINCGYGVLFPYFSGKTIGVCLVI
jgi:hypothetical protein